MNRRKIFQSTIGCFFQLSVSRTLFAHSLHIHTHTPTRMQTRRPVLPAATNPVFLSFRQKGQGLSLEQACEKSWMMRKWKIEILVPWILSPAVIAAWISLFDSGFLLVKTAPSI